MNDSVTDNEQKARFNLQIDIIPRKTHFQIYYLFDIASVIL